MANAGAAAGAILSLIFESGRRPDIDAMFRLAEEADDGIVFSVSHVAPAEQGWIELLAMGLTFDCAGLAPAASAPEPPTGTLLGLLEAPKGEVVSLAAGPHLGDAPGMQPVVRVLAGLGAQLCGLPGVLSVVWRPAHAWMTPTYFRKVVGKWLADGPFPALGLTTLERDSDGSIYTRGLALMTGQELRFVPDAKLGAADIARIGVRLVHALIETDPLSVPHQFTGPSGAIIDVTPTPGTHFLRVAVRR